MKTRGIIVAVSVFLLCGLGFVLGAATAKTGGPAKEVPELKPLDLYVGAYEGTFTDPNGTEFTAVSSSKWAASGRIVLTEYKVGDGTEGVILRTYDPRAKVYRMCSLDTSGGMGAGEGAWDQATRTFTFPPKPTPDGAGNTTVLTSRFGQDRTETWSIVTKDRTGAVLIQVQGKNVFKSK